MKKVEGRETLEYRQWLDMVADEFRKIWFLDRAEDYGEAFLEHLETYERLNPDTAEGHYWLARCLRARGELELALVQAREAYDRRSQQPLI